MTSKIFEIHNEFHICRYKNGIKLISPLDLLNKHQNTQNAGLTVGQLLDSPFCVYFSDPNTVNINLNEETIISCGYNSYKDALNKSLNHVMDKSSVDNLIHGNKKILNSEKTQILEEVSIRKDSINVPTLSLKTPWYNKDNKIVGLLGLTIVLGKHALLSSLQKIRKLELISDFYLNALTKNEIVYTNDELFEKITLTCRQKDCLYYLVKGMTLKEIAKKLDLSPKTIEHYINNVKVKLNCKTRAELIVKSIQLLSI